MKGVTQYIMGVDQVMQISTHTPVKGVTILKILNPTGTSISTHTPVKGVTLGQCHAFANRQISTHTPVKGVTLNPELPLNASIFQLTRP